MYRSERRYDDHKNIYSDILQNAPFRGQIFKNFLRLRRQGGIDPLTKILWTPLSSCIAVKPSSERS